MNDFIQSSGVFPHEMRNLEAGLFHYAVCVLVLRLSNAIQIYIVYVVFREETIYLIISDLWMCAATKHGDKQKNISPMTCNRSAKNSRSSLDSAASLPCSSLPF